MAHSYAPLLPCNSFTSPHAHKTCKTPFLTWLLISLLLSRQLPINITLISLVQVHLPREEVTMPPTALLLKNCPHSPSSHHILHISTPTHLPPPPLSGRHSRESSFGSRSEEELIVQRSRAESPVGARERWRRAIEKQLPEIRRRMTAREKTFPGLSGNGAISLVEL